MFFHLLLAALWQIQSLTQQIAQSWIMIPNSDWMMLIMFSSWRCTLSLPHTYSHPHMFPKWGFNLKHLYFLTRSWEILTQRSVWHQGKQHKNEKVQNVKGVFVQRRRNTDIRPGWFRVDLLRQEFEKLLSKLRLSSVINLLSHRHLRTTTDRTHTHTHTNKQSLLITWMQLFCCCSLQRTVTTPLWCHREGHASDRTRRFIAVVPHDLILDKCLLKRYHLNFSVS